MSPSSPGPPHAALPTSAQTDADGKISFLSVLTWKHLGEESLKRTVFGRSFYFSLFYSEKQIFSFLPPSISMKDQQTRGFPSFLHVREVLAVLRPSHPPGLPHPFYLPESRVPLAALPGGNAAAALSSLNKSPHVGGAGSRQSPRRA